MVGQEGKRGSGTGGSEKVNGHPSPVQPELELTWLNLADDAAISTVLVPQT